MTHATTPHDGPDPHGAHDSHACDDAHFDDGIPHVSAREYLNGFVLSVVLTAIPFALVMTKTISNPTLAAVVILLFAAAQIVVHMVYFLHMNTKSEGGWSTPGSWIRPATSMGTGCPTSWGNCPRRSM